MVQELNRGIPPITPAVPATTELFRKFLRDNGLLDCIWNIIFNNYLSVIQGTDRFIKNTKKEFVKLTIMEMNGTQIA
ncbi:MAG: hypothetical protein A2071_04420 [Bacteroidetes bacterium GWC1_47_7]|nr:MAG: hypothetical protein A2071_04420 [Bacteroidetes bacterium GWC1_47_7]